MKCSLKECEWCMFGQCCPESEEIYNEAIPNSKECPHYFDLKSAAEEEVKEIIINIQRIFEEVGNPLNQKAIDELHNMKGFDLYEAYKGAYDMFQKHLETKALGQIVDELDEHGVEWVKDKYKIKSKFYKGW